MWLSAMSVSPRLMRLRSDPSSKIDIERFISASMRFARSYISVGGSDVRALICTKVPSISPSTSV